MAQEDFEDIEDYTEVDACPLPQSSAWQSEEDAHESPKAVIASLVSNILIAIIKFIAAAFTGSSAMIAEGIHSLVDTGNGALVLLGIKRSSKPADTKHPFGYGPELYFWSLIVAISIFGIGGGMSLYEGISHIENPSDLTNPTLNYIVLAISFLVEGASLFIALRQFSRAKGTMSAYKFIRVSKDPSLFTIVFEDSAAILGLFIAFLGVYLGHTFDNPYFDGAASILIGLILMGVAFLLARESKDLLIGEGVEENVLIDMKRIILQNKNIESLRSIRTMYRGPKDLLVNLDIECDPDLSAEEVEEVIVHTENALRKAYPEINHVYIETSVLDLSPKRSGRAQF